MHSSIINRLARFIGTLLALQLVGMTLVMSGLVITRYLFSYSPSWSEEVTRYLMVWMVMLGASVLTLYEDHIALYSLVSKFKPKARLYHRLVCSIVTLIIACIVGYASWSFSTNIRGIAPGLDVSLLIPTLAIPVGMTLIALAAAINVVRTYRLTHGVEVLSIQNQNELMDGSFKPADH